MEHRHHGSPRSFLWAIALLLCSIGAVSAQTTAFTYQGKLTDAGSLANGFYDLQFKLFDTAAAGTGTQQGGTQVTNAVQASSGVFTVMLDFGTGVFVATDRFLEIGVRPAGSGNAFVVLSPRQPITSAPYSVQTINAQQLGGLPANRYLASAVNGQFGIGTPSPQAPLNVNGTTWFQGDTTPLPAAAGKGVAMGFTGDHGYLFGFDYAAFTPKNLLLNHPGANVGVGTSNPTDGRLHVEGGNGTAVYAHSNSSVGLLGTSTQFEGVRGEGSDVNHGAVVGVHKAAGVGVFGTSTGTGAGVQGFSSDGWGVIGTSTTSRGVHGESFGGSGFGVYARNSNGYALGVDGHATQNRDRGGLVKAMLGATSAGTIERCFNAFLPGAAATTVPCGFTVQHAGVGVYQVDFGFYIYDRFFSGVAKTNGIGAGIGVFNHSLTVNQVTVVTALGGDLFDLFFDLIVY